MTEKAENNIGKREQHLINEVNFISEGNADLEFQKERAKEAQEKFEVQQKHKNRKSLRTQLRNNAIKKQKQYNKLVKETDLFNRMSKNEIDYYNKLKNDKIVKEKELDETVSRESLGYERKKIRLTQEKDKNENTKIKDTTRSDKFGNLGIIKKKKKGKINVKLPTNLSNLKVDDIKSA